MTRDADAAPRIEALRREIRRHDELTATSSALSALKALTSITPAPSSLSVGNSCCSVSSWVGRRPSLGGYVTGGATSGATAAGGG